MSDLTKTCPVCDASTSAIGMAYRNGDPCPYCGTSEETAELIWGARDRLADQKLVDQLVATQAELQKLTIEVMRLRGFRRSLEGAIHELNAPVDKTPFGEAW